MQFDMPKESNSIIKVIGVGGGGSNAVNHMFQQGIVGVNFAICNTDNQALDVSPVPNKFQIGPELTGGLGAGSIPEVGRQAAEESIEEIKAFLGQNTKMVFVTAGMGGGTGTGAAPVIARAAREMGILTVGIITVPFLFEGPKRKKYALAGLEDIKQNVDTMIVISNDKLRQIFGNLKLTEAFCKADEVLTIAAKGIAELITHPLRINVDFADVNTVMKESGVAIMGAATASGDNRAMKAVSEAMNSPLLNDDSIEGAKYVLLNITYGSDVELTMDELSDITDFIMQEAGSDTDIIWGHGEDERLGDSVNVTLVATGFESKHMRDNVKARTGNTINQPKRVIHQLDEEVTPNQFDNKYTEPKAANEVIFDNSTKHTSSQNDLFNTVPDTVKEDENKEEDIFNFEVKSREELEAEKEKSEQTKIAESRRETLRKLSLNMTDPNQIAELEKEPAYKRKNVNLSNFPSSADSNISRYKLNIEKDESGEEQPPVIRKNNPFIHDNVD